MRFTTLKSKLLLGVTVAVLTSGFLISFLVTHRYGESLHASLIAQAKYLTEAVGLEAADLLLTHDLVALQKLLDRQLQSNPFLAYLMVVERDRVLAHTLGAGIPEGLVEANPVDRDAGPTPRAILTETGDHILDLAFPIFHGRAGVLRVGYSETGYRRQVSQLQWQMAVFTLCVLIAAMAGGILFIRRITGPVTDLAAAVHRVDQGDLEAAVTVRGQDEVAALGQSFNHMVTRLNSYTSKLEEQTVELERAHQQTRTFCGLVREIGSMHTLREVGRALLERFQTIFHSDWISLVIFNELQERLFIISGNGFTTNNDTRLIDRANAAMEALRTGDNGGRKVLQLAAPPFTPTPWNPDNGSFQAEVLIHEDSPFGILMLGCGPDCRCGPHEIDLAKAMAEQAAGVIQRAVLHEEEIQDLQDRLECSSAFCGIVGKAPEMQTVFKLIEDIAPTDATVLIQGESGTGKELVASSIHESSDRADKPFLKINCSAIPETLVESILFGHEKGAFTNAVSTRQGLFEEADNGTLLLDEISEMPIHLQAKLLRVLQEQSLTRVGSSKEISVDVRIIATTNRNIEELIVDGGFRSDLYYRLNVFPIIIPPIRDRRDDIQLLVRHFIETFRKKYGFEKKDVSEEAWEIILKYDWPGNVREIENLVERAILYSGNGIQLKENHFHLQPLRRNHKSNGALVVGSVSMAEVEKYVILKTLKICDDNRTKAADILGITSRTLRNKLSQYKLDF